MTLTVTAIDNAKTLGKPYKLADEKGLFLLVTPHGKWWRFRYRFGGKQNSLSMGVYPEVALIDARQRRDEARQLLAQGIDPAVIRREEKTRQKAECLAEADSSTVQVSVAINGAVEIWKGRAMVRLTVDESRAVNELLTKLSA